MTMEILQASPKYGQQPSNPIIVSSKRKRTGHYVANILRSLAHPSKVTPSLQEKGQTTKSLKNSQEAVRSQKNTEIKTSQAAWNCLSSIFNKKSSPSVSPSSSDTSIATKESSNASTSANNDHFMIIIEDDPENTIDV